MSDMNHGDGGGGSVNVSVRGSEGQESGHIRDALRGCRGLRRLQRWLRSVGLLLDRWDCGQGGGFWIRRRRICVVLVVLESESEIGRGSMSKFPTHAEQ